MTAISDGTHLHLGVVAVRGDIHENNKKKRRKKQDWDINAGAVGSFSYLSDNSPDMFM